MRPRRSEICFSSIEAVEHGSLNEAGMGKSLMGDAIASLDSPEPSSLRILSSPAGLESVFAGDELEDLANEGARADFDADCMWDIEAV